MGWGKAAALLACALTTVLCCKPQQLYDMLSSRARPSPAPHIHAGQHARNLGAAHGVAKRVAEPGVHRKVAPDELQHGGRGEGGSDASRDLLLSGKVPERLGCQALRGHTQAKSEQGLRGRRRSGRGGAGRSPPPASRRCWG